MAHGLRAVYVLEAVGGVVGGLPITNPLTPCLQSVQMVRRLAVLKLAWALSSCWRHARLAETGVFHSLICSYAVRRRFS